MVDRTIKAELPPDDQKPETNEIFTRPGLFGRSTSDQGFKANTSRSPVAKRRFSAGADIVSISKENSVNYFCPDAPHIQSPGKTKEKQSKGDETTGYTEKTKSGIEVPCIQTASDQNEKSPRGTKYLAVSSYAGEESGVVSPQYGEEVEVLEKRSETQGKEILIAMSERTIMGESDMEFHVQKQERVLISQFNYYSAHKISQQIIVYLKRYEDLCVELLWTISLSFPILNFMVLFSVDKLCLVTMGRIKSMSKHEIKRA